MKIKLLIFLALITLFFGTSSQTYAFEQVVNSEAIDVEGYMNKQLAQDEEILKIKNEIKQQKEMIVLNKEKSKHFKELSKSVEALTETTVEYLEEKKAAQAGIAEYNAKIKCLQMNNPDSNCNRYLNKKR